jgi:Carboxypeptidase regulatory-like domain
MRLAALPISLVTILSALIASAQRPDHPTVGQTATIRGVVVTVNDKKPVSQALVSLDESHRSVTTNEKGEFVFTDVPFGTEVIIVKRNGFLCTSAHWPGPVCVKTVKVHAPDTRIELTMLPEAVVTGRVVDQAGMPIRNLALELLRRQITQGGHYAWPGLTAARTDADGVFRIVKIEPGTYLLHVPTAFDPPDVSPPPHSESGYSATYYPGVLNQKEAQPLVIHAGDEIKANLTVRRESVQPITLNSLWHFQVEPGSIGWAVSDSSGPVMVVPEPVKLSHSIHFLALPGDYNASFVLNPPNDPQSEPRPWPDGTSKPYHGSAKFTVRDRPVIIDDIPLQQSTNLSLRVHAQLTATEAQNTSPQSQLVILGGAVFELFGDNIQFNNQFVWGADRPASTFEFKDIPPGQYVLRAYGNASAYVASLTCGSVNLVREPLVIGPGIPACSIEAVIRDDLASLSIGLTPQARAQIGPPGTKLTAFALVPVDKPFDVPFSGSVSGDSAPDKVRIPPGSYIAFLFDGHNRAWREPEFQEQLKHLGTLVTLAPGDDKTLILDFKPELNSPDFSPEDLGHALR